MDHSPLGSTPPELRNEVCRFVYNGTLQLCTDDHSLADVRSLVATCKQKRCETTYLRANPIHTIKLFSSLNKTTCGNKIVGVRFDLNKWLNIHRGYPLTRPTRIVLHVGQIDVTSVPVLGRAPKRS